MVLQFKVLSWYVPQFSLHGVWKLTILNLQRALFKGPQYGAYSELFAAFSPKVKVKNGSQFVIPWGQIGTLPDHIVKVMEPKSGSSAAQKFWDWCEKETLPFA